MANKKLISALEEIEMSSCQSLAAGVINIANAYSRQGNLCGFFPSLFGLSAKYLADELSAIINTDTGIHSESINKTMILVHVFAYIDYLSVSNKDLFLGPQIQDKLSRVLLDKKSLNIFQEECSDLIKNIKENCFMKFKTFPLIKKSDNVIFVRDEINKILESEEKEIKQDENTKLLK